jgi:hypothetical protein
MSPDDTPIALLSVTRPLLRDVALLRVIVPDVMLMRPEETAMALLRLTTPLLREMAEESVTMPLDRLVGLDSTTVGLLESVTRPLLRLVGLDRTTVGLLLSVTVPEVRLVGVRAMLRAPEDDTMATAVLASLPRTMRSRLTAPRRVASS